MRETQVDELIDARIENEEPGKARLRLVDSIGLCIADVTLKVSLREEEAAEAKDQEDPLLIWNL